MSRTKTLSDWLVQHWRTAWALGLALFVVASAFRIVEARALDSPTGDEWLAAGAQVFVPWLERDGGEMAVARWLGREPWAGEWIWTLGSVLLNGQWDPRLGALGAAVALALAVFGLSRSVLHGLSGGAAPCVAVAMAAGWCLPGVSQEVAGSWNGAAGWVWLLGWAHLTFTWRTPHRPWGHALGFMAAVASPAGIASALALSIGFGVLPRRGAGERRAVGTIAWNALLFLAGLWRFQAGGDPGPDGAMSFSNWGHTAALALFALPGMVLAVRLRGAGARGDAAGGPGLVVVVTAWILLLGISPAGSGLAATAVGVAVALGVQAAAWSHLWTLEIGRRRRAVLWATAWGLAGLPFLIATHRGLPSPVEMTQEAQRRADGVRTFMATGDRVALAEALEVSMDEAAQVADLLGDPRMSRWLPSTVRAPLAVWSAPTDDEVFSMERVPSLPGLPAGHEAVSSDAAGATGERRSGSFATEFPLLQVYVAGTGEPGRTELWLETRAGERLRALQTSFEATGGWRRVNLPVAPGPATLVVRDESAATWLAVAAPVELGRGTWLAGKVAGAGAPVALVAVLALGLAAVGGGREAWRAFRSTDPAVWTDVARRAPWVALAAYAMVLIGFLDTHAAGADAAGYLAQARLLRDGELTVSMRTVAGVEVSERIYAPLGFVPREDGRLAPGYPSGLPLMIAAFAVVLPLTWAVAVVNALHVVGGVMMVHLLARACGLPGGWSWVAAFWVGLSPAYVFMGLQPMTDVPSMTWLAAAMWLALRSRRGARWALACGAATAVAVLLRPVNALAFVPLVILLGSWRTVGWWILGAVPGAAWQLWHAWSLYGSPLATGYGDMSGAFGWEWVGPTLGHYLVQFPVNFTPLVALALAAPFLSDAERRVRWALAAWAGLFLAFYAGYFFTHLAWWYQRFLVPAYPALAILALLALRAWTERRGLRLFAAGGGTKGILAGAVLVACLAVPAAVQGRRLLVLHPADGNSRYTELAQWATANLPADAAIFAFETSTALFHHSGFTILRFDQVERSDNERVASRLLAEGRPVYAVVFHLAEQAEINLRLPEGEWREVRRLGHMEVRRLEALAPAADGRTGEN